jgi:glycosyltransferase involved in cell wall biosynthesis
MNICMVASAALPPQEGMGYYIWNLSRFLVQQGHTVHIITRGGLGRTECQTHDGITVWRVTFAPVYPMHVHLHGWFANRLVAQLEKDVDVFHLHSPLPAIIQPRCPIVLTVHSPMLAATRALKLRDLTTLLIKLQTPVSISIERQLIRRARQVTVVGSPTVADLREYGIDPLKVEVMGNGVDTEAFRPQPISPELPLQVLAVGRLAVGKGFEDLVECARLVTTQQPKVRFCIAGSGPLEKELRARITQAGLGERMQLLGHIADRTQMKALYQRAALFVHPAHYEGLPTVLLEAMACARPCVATAVSGALDVIQPGENGCLVPPHNPAKMANVILRLLADPALAQRLGDAARRTIEARYSWEVVGAHYVQLYQQLVTA